MTPIRRAEANVPTRDAIYAAAATLFSSRGFDGVSMDDVARSAGVNKAMIYYHFADKLELFRTVVGDGLAAMNETVSAIAASDAPPPEKLDQFITAFVRMTEARPWMPAIMLREVAEGAPRLDPDRLAHMRGVIMNFAGILAQGQALGVFRPMHPVLAYESIIGPIIINTARERVASQPGRSPQQFPMLVEISHDDVIAHVQHTARRMLAP